MSYTLGKIEKCYSVKAFMSYTVHWANEYFIISFVLSHLFILFSLSPALSLSLFSFTGCISLFSFFFFCFFCFFRSVMVMVMAAVSLSSLSSSSSLASFAASSSSSSNR
jgi:hypothetical protein